MLSGWSLTDSIGPDDVGLSEELSDDDRGHGIFGLNRLDRVARWAQPITYRDIYESDSFTVLLILIVSFFTTFANDWTQIFLIR